MSDENPFVRIENKLKPTFERKIEGLTDRDLKIIGQRLKYLDYLFTKAGNEIEMHFYLTQMVAIANEIGIDVVKPEDVDLAFELRNRYDDPYLWTIATWLSRLRAKVIVECVKRGIIEEFDEIPVGIELEREDKEREETRVRL